MVRDQDRFEDGKGSVIYFVTIGSRPSSWSRYALSNRDDVIFTAQLVGGAYTSGFFLYSEGKLSKLALADEPAPDTDGQSFGDSLFFENFSLNSTGDFAFHARLCCGQFRDGIYLSGYPTAAIPNGDFEDLGARGLPAAWETVWSNSGGGEAFRYEGGAEDAFQGSSALRLHATAGGATFVLSDPVPVTLDTTYRITSRMRFNLRSPSDAVYFSVLQYDGSGREIGVDEMRASTNEILWTWLPRRLVIRTKPETATIRLRFGLASASEAYLDVDGVY